LYVFGATSTCTGTFSVVTKWEDEELDDEGVSSGADASDEERIDFSGSVGWWTSTVFFLVAELE
jgi:hypothetical protein